MGYLLVFDQLRLARFIASSPFLVPLFSLLQLHEYVAGVTTWMLDLSNCFRSRRWLSDVHRAMYNPRRSVNLTVLFGADRLDQKVLSRKRTECEALKSTTCHWILESWER
jgi:hypothetical protein